MATDKCTTPAPFTVDVTAPTLGVRLLWWGTLVAVFALAAYPRFVRLPDRGIQRSNTRALGEHRVVAAGNLAAGNRWPARYAKAAPLGDLPDVSFVDFR